MALSPVKATLGPVNPGHAGALETLTGAETPAGSHR